MARIAELAGVSAPTVSKVLNGRPGVGQDTRRRVEALLCEHGYRRPDSVPPAPTVEVVFYGLESHLAVEIMRGVEQVAGEHHLTASFTEAHGRGSESWTWADRLRARRPTGVITAHAHLTPGQHAQLRASGIPLVALDPVGEILDTVPSVGATNWSGGVAATRHLLDLGHRRIGLLGGPLDYLCARARLEACRATMETAGIPVDPRLVRTGQFLFADGLRFGDELLGLPRPPTAIICGNDLQALGVYEAARRTGLRIPEELSVVGFDDIEYTRWCGPRMTTVRQPFTEMATTATRMLLALAAGETPAQTRIELATTLVVRESTAAPTPRSVQGRNLRAPSTC